jgi:uncharacterized protein (PEP-CTERM system associated)
MSMMRSLVILSASAAVVFAPEAHARKRTRVRPYIEIDQSVFKDFKNNTPVQSYTTVAAGVDASVTTRRAEAQVSYRYEHRFGLTRGLSDADTHSGLARGRYTLVPELLQFDAGALATRTRTDIRGVAPNLSVGNPANVSQLYSAYAGPTLATRLGAFDVGALYRFGYTKVESRTRGVLLPNQPNLGSFDDSTSHVASAHANIGAGDLPFAWRVTGSYQREDSGQLDQRFESKTVRGDVTVPVTPTLALVGGAGYEDIQSSQRDAVRDAAGVAQFDGNGRFITDRTSPRQIAYDSTGFIWDVGVLWKPSARTAVEGRVGQRYGSTSYTGSLSYQPTDNMAVSITLYDGIQTFGRQVSGALSSLPTQFTVGRNPFGGEISGCVYGAEGGGAGGCLNDTLQSVSNGTYRSRGLNGVWRYTGGLWSVGVGAGYAERRFFAPTGALAAANGAVDRSVYAQAFVSRRIDAQSGIDGNAYINWYNGGAANSLSVLGTGATASYYRNFGRRFSGIASLGLYSTRVDSIESSLTGAAQLGARYQF